MLTLTIWRIAILLESVILFRGYRAKLLSKYPFFYAYIASVLTSDSIFYFVYMESRSAYTKWYWISWLVVMIVGYGIILEIFKHVLSAYPGAERFARVVGIGTFVVIFGFVTTYPLWASEGQRAASTIDIQRDFCNVQALFLFSIFGVASYYRIPLGKNLKGMTFGYGLCLSVTLVSLALRSFVGVAFNTAWFFAQPFSFDVALFVWATTLWAYHPNPVPDPTIRLETDYEMFVSRTRDKLGAMRDYFGKAGRS